MASTEQIRWYKQAVQWASAVEALVGEKYPKPARQFLESLKELAEQFETGQPLVAFFGHFSSGKTSLVNQIMGAEVLPVNLDETTAIHTLVAYDQGGSRLQLPLGNGWSDVDSAISEAFFQLTPSRLRQSPVLAHILNQRLWVRYLTNRLQPRARGIRFLDTPGLGSRTMHQGFKSLKRILDRSATRSEEIARKGMRQKERGEDNTSTLLEWLDELATWIQSVTEQVPFLVDAELVFWVVDIQQGLKRRDVELIEAVSQLNPTVVVLNKADLLVESDRDQQVRKARELLKRGGLESVPVMALSAHDPSDGKGLLDFVVGRLSGVEQRWAEDFSFFLALQHQLLDLWASEDARPDAQRAAKELLMQVDLSGHFKEAMRKLRRFFQYPDEAHAKVYNDYMEAWEEKTFDDLDGRVTASVFAHVVDSLGAQWARGVADVALELTGRANGHMIITDFYADEAAVADFWGAMNSRVAFVEEFVSRMLPFALDLDLRMADALVGRYQALVDRGRLLGTYLGDEEEGK